MVLEYGVEGKLLSTIQALDFLHNYICHKSSTVISHDVTVGKRGITSIRSNGWIIYKSDNSSATVEFWLKNQQSFSLVFFEDRRNQYGTNPIRAAAQCSSL